MISTNRVHFFTLVCRMGLMAPDVSLLYYYTQCLIDRCMDRCRDVEIYICLFHHEGSTKSITDKKYKNDSTKARGMYKNIKSYLTNTFKPT